MGNGGSAQAHCGDSNRRSNMGMWGQRGGAHRGDSSGGRSGGGAVGRGEVGRVGDDTARNFVGDGR
jgi:hypothetical protein